MPPLLPCLLLFTAGFATAADLAVQIEPRWREKPLRLAEAGLKNAAGNELSVTRLAMLLSNAKLQRADGSWIGAGEWFAFLDVEKKRTASSASRTPPLPSTVIWTARFTRATAPQSGPPA